MNVNLDKYDCIVIVGDYTNSLYERTCKELRIPKCFRWENNIDYLITQIHKRQEMLTAKKQQHTLLFLYTDENEILSQLEGYADLVHLTEDVYFTGEVNTNYIQFGFQNS